MILELVGKYAVRKVCRSISSGGYCLRFIQRLYPAILSFFSGNDRKNKQSSPVVETVHKDEVSSPVIHHGMDGIDVGSASSK